MLDISLNHGNSGGAIIKMGKSIDEDSVIGIVDFGLNPLDNVIDSIMQYLYSMIGSETLEGLNNQKGQKMPAFDPILLQYVIADKVSKIPVGVNGCISIEYLKKEYEGLKKKFSF